jgi:hypothetical protein
MKTTAHFVYKKDMFTSGVSWEYNGLRKSMSCRIFFLCVVGHLLVLLHFISREGRILSSYPFAHVCTCVHMCAHVSVPLTISWWLGDSFYEARYI